MKKWNRVLRQYTAELEQLNEQLGFAELEPDYPPLKEWGNRSSLWDDMEMFGYEVTDHQLESLKGFYKDPLTGNSRSEYHVPSEREIEVELLTVSVDSPPSYKVAWDAKPITSNSVAIR
jgi:hypothetical protein